MSKGSSTTRSGSAATTRTASVANGGNMFANEAARFPGGVSAYLQNERQAISDVKAEFRRNWENYGDINSFDVSAGTLSIESETIVNDENQLGNLRNYSARVLPGNRSEVNRSLTDTEKNAYKIAEKLKGEGVIINRIEIDERLRTGR